MVHEKYSEASPPLPALFVQQWELRKGELRHCIARRIPQRLQAVISADDLLHDVWIAAAGQLAGFQQQRTGGLFHWLERIAIGKTVDAVRKFHRTEQRWPTTKPSHKKFSKSLGEFFGLVPDSQRTPSSLNARSESITCLRRVLSCLREPENAMIRMHFLEGVADEDIARRMNLTLGAVRGSIYRTKLKLRSMMGSSSKFYSDVG